jgi:hypothetical protein
MLTDQRFWLGVLAGVALTWAYHRYAMQKSPQGS